MEEGSGVWRMDREREWIGNANGSGMRMGMGMGMGVALADRYRIVYVVTSVRNGESSALVLVWALVESAGRGRSLLPALKPGLASFS